jgi:hypothetical protein
MILKKGTGISERTGINFNKDLYLNNFLIEREGDGLKIIFLVY